MSEGKIVMGGLANLQALSDAFDSDASGENEEYIMVVRFPTREDFIKANSGKSIALEWDFDDPTAPNSEGEG